jgi:hypothetical protein
LHKFCGAGQIEIDQLPTIVADRMIVAIGFAIIATRAVSKIYLVNQSGVLQIAQGVINGCVTDTGQSPACSFKDLAGSRVIVTLLDHLKNRFSLGSQLWLILCRLHDGFRLILNQKIVKPRINTDFNQIFLRINPWLKSRVLASEVDDAVDVAFERRAMNAVRREEILRLA